MIRRTSSTREEQGVGGEERDVQERDHRLGGGQGERPEARALPAGEDDRGYLVGVQGSASPISITGMPSRMGYAFRQAGQMMRVSSKISSPLHAGHARMA